MLSRQRLWQKRHKQLGLCKQCSRPCLAGRVLCEVHRTTQQKRLAKQRRKRGAPRVTCGCCGARGHNIRTCPDPRARQVAA